MMLRHVLVGLLMGLLASAGGCAAPRLSVRSDRGKASVVDLQLVRPVEYSQEDLQEAMGLYAEHLAAVIQRSEGQLRLRLAQAWVEPTDPAQQALVEAYAGWCARRGAPGDCLELLDARTPGLSTDDKRTIALRMALASGLHEAAEVVRNINPVKVEATLVIWFTVYLGTLVFPDATVTKALFVIMTANLIAFLGVDGFRNVIQGYRDMVKEVDTVGTFDQLRVAGERYGRRMGPSMVRIVTALVTWGVGTATGIARPVTDLPGGAQAVANAQAQGFQLMAVSGGSVSVSATGAATLVLAGQAAVPDRAGGSDGASGEPLPEASPEPATPRYVSRPSGETLDVAKIRIPGPRNSAYGKLDYLLGRVPIQDSAGKGRFFEGVLGFDKTSLGPALERHLVENFGTATIEGSRIRALGTLLGANGRKAKVLSVWQTTADGLVELITAVPR
jgi:hypothetical protein